MARPRKFDEDHVLLAVRDEFWDKGYAATSLEDLLRVSGLGKGSLYGAFGDKQKLFLRVLRDYDDTNLLMLRERLESSARGADLVREFVLGPASDPTGAAARRGCLLANSNAELAISTPEVAAEARRSYDAITAILTEALERARREGDLAPDADPAETARATLVAQLGLVALGRTGVDIGTLTAAAQAVLARFLPAIAPR
ncbi:MULTISPECIES: TetR/AcrR family transcriptional regulator [Streptomyces]|uniref:Transcriptional regulator n=2 Tax=Streptomyces TaxID=1883 RepID=A0A0W7X1L8_9ACTN|nr:MULTISPECIES: TetR/AcrR family transcriptional regulator [Streptomyces]KUF16639.1 transcriptional regulator [Streptomyces silvensis]MVO86220.1 TetR family transcriptional regulator [Streptomyces typhae]